MRFLHQRPDAVFSRNYGTPCHAFGFLLTFAENIQASGINHQMTDFSPSGRFKTIINVFRAFADAAVIRAAKRDIHKREN